MSKDKYLEDIERRLDSLEKGINKNACGCAVLASLKNREDIYNNICNSFDFIDLHDRDIIPYFPIEKGVGFKL